MVSGFDDAVELLRCAGILTSVPDIVLRGLSERDRARYAAALRIIAAQTEAGLPATENMLF